MSSILFHTMSFFFFFPSNQWHSANRGNLNRLKQSQKAARWCEKALIFAGYVNERMEQQVCGILLEWGSNRVPSPEYGLVMRGWTNEVKTFYSYRRCM